jgi:hypothetical protein
LTTLIGNGLWKAILGNSRALGYMSVGAFNSVSKHSWKLDTYTHTHTHTHPYGSENMSRGAADRTQYLVYARQVLYH